MIEGSCCCGTVKFRLKAEPSMMAHFITLLQGSGTDSMQMEALLMVSLQSKPN